MRNHNRAVFKGFGRDKGYYILRQVNFVDGLAPLVNEGGDVSGLKSIVFTLDETIFGREFAPMARAYSALCIGLTWWFFDCPDGLRRQDETVVKTAGCYNTEGLIDGTRAFPYLPAHHDMARRVDRRREGTEQCNPQELLWNCAGASLRPI